MSQIRRLAKVLNINSGIKMTKILFLAANPSDTTRLHVGKEHREIDAALQAAELRGIKLESHYAVRTSDLATLLLRHKPDIVHFSGHGSPSNEIILEDETGYSQPVSKQALGSLFRLLRNNIRCVVLNACYSEDQAKSIAEEIDCVVGMSHAIDDESATIFAKAFYTGLAYGKDVQTAFDLARTQLDLQGRLSEHEGPKLLSKKSPNAIRFEAIRESESPAEENPPLAPLFERISAVAAASVCLGLLSFLLIRGEAFVDPTLAVIARTFMSLAAAIFGATIPGFLQVAWSRNGLMIRAGGALALFVLTYFGSPSVVSATLGPADVNLQVPQVVDIRSFYGPTIDYEQMLEDKAIVVMRMTYTNSAQPAKNAFINRESVSATFDDLAFEYEWQYFVNLVPGGRCWPCIEESVSTVTVPAGESVAHETLFDAEQGPAWGEFIQTFLASSVETASFIVTADVDGQLHTSTCLVVNLPHWREVVVDWIAANENRFPARLTLPCEQ